MNRWRELANMNIRPAIEYCGRSRRYVWELTGAAVVMITVLCWIIGGFLL